MTQHKASAQHGKPARPASLRADLDPHAAGYDTAETGSWLARLRADMRLAIVTLYGGCSVLLITPFAIYRFIIGDVLIGVADLMIVAAFAALVIYAWLPGKSAPAGNITAVVAAIAVLVVISLFGLDHAWAYATLSGNFLLAHRRLAMVNCTAVILGIGFQTHLFASTVNLTTFIAVAMMVSLFGLIFASRADSKYRKLSDLATVDPLTGALNRRAMTMIMSTLTRHHQLNHQPAGVAMLDLDRFKRLNDDHGHETGDRILVQLVEIIRANTRATDHLFRFGGEEFVLMLPGTSEDGMRLVLDHLYQAINQTLRGPDYPVTVSMGAAMLEDYEDWTTWLSRADEALFAAKRAGRNRVAFNTRDDGIILWTAPPATAQQRRAS